MRIPYTEKVDMWSLGCILAELYTGEPIFPGDNEQEQLEFIMEIKGIPSNEMIDKSRKKNHYFDTDYSPYLIEEPDCGILRIPESRDLQSAIPSKNMLYLDFVNRCLELDPEIRFSASEALKHPWMQDYIRKQKRKTDNFENPYALKAKVSRSLSVDQASFNEENVMSSEDEFRNTRTNNLQSQLISMNQNSTISAVTRQRETDGAHASATENSPDNKLQAVFPGQKMISYSRAKQSEISSPRKSYSNYEESKSLNGMAFDFSDQKSKDSNQCDISTDFIQINSISLGQNMHRSMSPKSLSNKKKKPISPLKPSMIDAGDKKQIEKFDSIRSNIHQTAFVPASVVID